jgi:hypothetical protein
MKGVVFLKKVFMLGNEYMTFEYQKSTIFIFL